MTFTVPPVGDQSLDVVVADFNDDGFGDAYFSNQEVGVGPQPDTLYLSVMPASWAVGVPVWIDASTLLPDQLVGGTVPPSWSIMAK